MLPRGPNIHELYTKIDFKCLFLSILKEMTYIAGVQSENNTGAII